MSTSVDAASFLNESLAQQTSSIQSYTWNDQKVWIKKAGKHNSIWLYRLVGLATKILGLGTLRPVPSLGGKNAIKTEANRLQDLAALNINVPKVLAVNELGLMIQDLGTLDKPAQQLDTTLLHCADKGLSFKLFCATVDSILDTHQKGGWLSEAFIRNILIDDHCNIGFIDFETDPRDYLNIADCYARDWLYFMYSVAIRMEHHDLLKKASEYLKNAISKESQITQYALQMSYARLTWIKTLPVGKLGHDGQRLSSTSTLFSLMK